MNSPWRFTVVLPITWKKPLQHEAVEQGITVLELIRQALAEKFKLKEGERG